jgi:hypothetical protein
MALEFTEIVEYTDLLKRNSALSTVGLIKFQDNLWGSIDMY